MSTNKNISLYKIFMKSNLTLTHTNKEKNRMRYHDKFIKANNLWKDYSVYTNARNILFKDIKKEILRKHMLRITEIIIKYKTNKSITWS